MQEYRDDEMVSGAMLPDDAPTALDKLVESFKKLRDGEIDHVRIGRFPEVRELIEVNGLVFVVTRNEGETFTAKFLKPEDD